MVFFLNKKKKLNDIIWKEKTLMASSSPRLVGRQIHCFAHVIFYLFFGNLKKIKYFLGVHAKSEIFIFNLTSSKGILEDFCGK